MWKNFKRSIDAMPRCVYIFHISILRICALMLCVSLLLFLRENKSAQDYEQYKMAFIYLENASIPLLFGIVGAALFSPRR